MKRVLFMSLVGALAAGQVFQYDRQLKIECSDDTSGKQCRRARGACLKALEVLARNVQFDTRVSVMVDFVTDMGSGVLGQARVRKVNGRHRSDGREFSFPTACAANFERRGFEMEGARGEGIPDVMVELNANVTWAYDPRGADHRPGTTTRMLDTLVHEIAHGLGFVETGLDGQGRCGCQERPPVQQLYIRLGSESGLKSARTLYDACQEACSASDPSLASTLQAALTSTFTTASPASAFLTLPNQSSSSLLFQHLELDTQHRVFNAGSSGFHLRQNQKGKDRLMESYASPEDGLMLTMADGAVLGPRTLGGLVATCGARLKEEAAVALSKERVDGTALGGQAMGDRGDRTNGQDEFKEALKARLVKALSEWPPVEQEAPSSFAPQARLHPLAALVALALYIAATRY